MKRYPTAKHLIKREDKDSVLEVLGSEFLSLGPKNRDLETEFVKKIGTKYASSVSSGTAGLHLAMLAAGIGPGDEVITSPFSYIASANSILYVGAKPVFVDIDLNGYGIDPSKIEEKISGKTKAILVVHVFCQPAEMDPIMKIARKYKLKIIEDACEVVGAKYKGKPVGSLGDVGVFAFFPNKQVISGEGGMIVTNNRNIHDLVLSLKNQGKPVGASWFGFERLGYNYRMDEMSAALALSQFRRIKEILRERNQIAALYGKYLSEFNNFLAIPEIPSYMHPSWFVYAIRIIDPKIKRDTVMTKLAEKGIATREYFPSIHLMPFYEHLGYKIGDFPNSELASKNCFVLPFYLGLTDTDVRYISKNLIDILKEEAEVDER